MTNKKTPNNINQDIKAGPASGDVSVPGATGTAREVWVAIREDGKPGNGSYPDPFDASSVQKLNALFDKFYKEYGDNLTIHFGAGTFYGNKPWVPANNWKIFGKGIDVTIFKTKADPTSVHAAGFRIGSYYGGPSGFEIAGVTFDLNVQQLRKANRTFVYQGGRQMLVYYYYAHDLPAWSSSVTYNRYDKKNQAVSYNGNQYICIKPNKNIKPGQNDYWSILQPNQPDQLPSWKATVQYKQGDAVVRNQITYICAAVTSKADPASGAKDWLKVAADAPDPLIYPHAVFVCSAPPGGKHWIRRVKAINGNGSRFFNQEAFPIGAGGSECVIEDCEVAHFHGDYSTLIATFLGKNNVIKNCTVHGNDGLATMGYGGWACFDTVFENNLATNCRSATNIDSLTSRHVTFRDNRFLNCREAGILVNLDGKKLPGYEKYFFPYQGQNIPLQVNQMDGLLVTGNHVEIRGSSLLSAIQLQRQGLQNVRVIDNKITKTAGTKTAKAIGIPNGVKNVEITGNICDTGMNAQVCKGAKYSNNRDTKGNPIPGL